MSKLPLIAFACLLASCASRPEAIMPTVSLPPTLTASATLTATPLPSPSGPEAPIASSSYPSSISVEQITEARTLISDAPSTITSLAEVQAIIAKHSELARQQGLVFDHMETEYVASIQRWYIYPADNQGNIVGWLQIEDPSSQTGWRYGEQPTWDSQFLPSQDTFRFGLPDLRDPQNHFEMVVINGFPILVEVAPDGDPQYWNSVTLKQILAIDGAVLPTEVPGYKPISEMTSESECSQNIIRTDHVQEDIARMIKQMEQNPNIITNIYVDGWFPSSGLPYPYFEIRIGAGSNPQIKYCGTSEDGNITYVALEAFPIRLGQGADIRYEYVPAIIALDLKALQKRSQVLLDDEPYFTAHMSLKALFEKNIGEIMIQIMGGKTNLYDNGFEQLTADVLGYSPAYITLIRRLAEDNDFANRIERIFSGQASEEDVQWLKTYLQSNPIPGVISVSRE